MDDFSEEPLLCSMASKIAVHGPSLVYQGKPAKGCTPNSGISDAMLAFSHAHKQSPAGWTIFEVKYLELEQKTGSLLKYVVEDLPGIPDRVALGRLVVHCFCTGSQLSRRSLRRSLGVDRVVAGEYYESARKTLYWLRVTEHEFAGLVRDGL